MYIWLVFGVLYAYKAYNERKLVQYIEILDDEMRIKSFSNVDVVPLSDVVNVTFNKHTKTCNGFGVKEIVINTLNNKKYIMPTNISNCSTLCEILDVKDW